MKIAKHATLILIACACGQASAQLAFKGMRLGENILDMAGKANLHCQAMDEDGGAAVLCQMEFQAQATPPEFRTLAGVPLNYLALHAPARSGKLGNIYMLFDSSDFDAVRLAYAQRYPSLDCRDGTFRGKTGAAYDQQVCRAETGGGVIELRKRSGSASDASVSISTHAWLAWQRAATGRQSASKGSNDL